MKRTPQQVINDLAIVHDLINKNTGRVNYSAFSKKSGIPHPTLIRIMQAGPEHSMNTRTVQALIDSFQITFAQARGDVPIKRNDKQKFTPSDGDIELLRRFKGLRKIDQDDIRKLIELREQLEAQ